MPPSRPMIVQYGCWPLKPRGYQPLGEGGRDGLDHLVGRGRERQRQHLQFGQAEGIVRPFGGQHAHVARLGFRQRDPVGAAIAIDHRARIAPLHAVVGQLHQVVAGLLARLPHQLEPAELAHAVQVQGQLRRRGRIEVRIPGRVRIAVHRQRSAAAAVGGRGAGRAGERAGVLRRQRGEGERIEAHRTLAAGVVVDRVLQLGAMAQRLVRVRPPGLVDLALAIGHRRPLAGKVVGRPIDPPHVVARGIGELELQIVGRRGPAQLEVEAIVVRIVQRHLALQPRIAGHAVVVVVQAQRLAAIGPGHRAQARGDLVGGHHLPGGRIVERIEHARLRLRRPRQAKRDQESDKRAATGHVNGVHQKDYGRFP